MFNNISRLPFISKFPSAAITTFICRSLTTKPPLSPPPTRICIVGSGPAGFYLTQNLLKLLDSKTTTIDILEKLPVPFGLVRYGVAPDHPEVKNVINTFTKIAEHPSVRFIGNIHIDGVSISLKQLQEFYHIIILAYGSSIEKGLNIPGENLPNVYSAKSFVGWYNGVPETSQLNPKLDHTETAVIIGMGNVALDCARILLTPIDDLYKTDITEQSLEILKHSRIKHVMLYARRGPLQVSFTIKELRELVQLKHTMPKLDLQDFSQITQEKLDKMERPRKRLTDLLLKTVNKGLIKESVSKYWYLKFFRAPKRILGADHVEGVEFDITEPIKDSDCFSENLQVQLSEDKRTDTIDCGLVIKSVGYHGLQIDPWLPFDVTRGIILNTQSRIHDRPGMYCVGWIGRGARGVIVDTTSESYVVAKRIVEDVKLNLIPNLNDIKSGGDGLVELAHTKHIKPIAYIDWKLIDKYEIQNGMTKGKPREKIVNVEKMLELITASKKTNEQ